MFIAATIVLIFSLLFLVASIQEKKATVFPDSEAFIKALAQLLSADLKQKGTIPSFNYWGSFDGTPLIRALKRLTRGALVCEVRKELDVYHTSFVTGFRRTYAYTLMIAGFIVAHATSAAVGWEVAVLSVAMVCFIVSTVYRAQSANHLYNVMYDIDEVIDVVRPPKCLQITNRNPDQN